MNLIFYTSESFPLPVSVLLLCLLALTSSLLPLKKLKPILFLFFTAAATTIGLLANADMLLLAAVLLLTISLSMVLTERRSAT